MRNLSMTYHRNGYEVTFDESGWLVRQADHPVAGPFGEFQEAERQAKALPMASWLSIGSCPSLLKDFNKV
jgi:hypothetical protein